MPTHALIIDDNRLNLNVLEQLLEREGCHYTSLVSPDQLPASLRNHADYDVIFLDLEMPGLNGFEVLNQLKATPQLQDTPVVAYTVHISEINTAYDAGFDGFLGKPIDSERFSDQLARILRGEGVWEAT